MALARSGTSFDDDILGIIKTFRNYSKLHNEDIEERFDLNEEVRKLKFQLQNSEEIQRKQSNTLSNLKQLINHQQTIIAQMVTDKEEIKRKSEEQKISEDKIKGLEHDINSLREEFKREKERLVAEYSTLLDKSVYDHDREVQRMKAEFASDKFKTDFEISDLKSQLQSIVEEKEEQIGMVALQHEERLQHINSIIIKKDAEIKNINERNNANILLYKRRIEELERNKQVGNPIGQFIDDSGQSSRSEIKESAPKKMQTFELNRRIQLEVRYEESNASRRKMAVKPLKRKLLNADENFF